MHGKIIAINVHSFYSVVWMYAGNGYIWLFEPMAIAWLLSFICALVVVLICDAGHLSCFCRVQHDVDGECVSGEMMQARNKSSHCSIERFMLLVLPCAHGHVPLSYCVRQPVGDIRFARIQVHFICLTISGYYRKRMTCFWCSFWSNDGPSAVATSRSSSTVQPNPMID